MAPQFSPVSGPPAFTSSVKTPVAKTLRDEFAMAALTGLMADPETPGMAGVIAIVAYGLADAMMKVFEGWHTDGLASTDQGAET